MKNGFMALCHVLLVTPKLAQNWGLPKRVIALITRNTLPRSWHIVVLGIFLTAMWRKVVKDF